MTIESGTRLGPYEISSRIGAGGMGEVWKAHDTRLERNVAIKVLPAELAENVQLRLRFEREAKTISQLNHPNICTLYDVGEGYLVMELLEGESLADRLSRGPLPMPEVLRLGAQIADALDRAHRAGVIHRDVKPGNVMLTKSGAKLLDFGLARNAVVDIADGATMHKPLTQEGTILGTFQYMAPEQLEGIEADARTDLFSLGAVLYEMATGLRAFDGKTKTSLIAAIVKEQPRSMSEVVPLTPRAFEHVVTRCLAKDPEERWQSARDVSQELRWIAESGSQSEAERPLARRRRISRWLPWAVALLAVSGALAMVVMRPRPSSQVMRFSAPNTITTRPGDSYGIIAISPDGSQIIYSTSDGTSRMLYRRSIDQYEAKPIPGTEDGVQPFFSPNGEWLGFFARQRLWKVALSGGQPIEIGRASVPRGAVWLEDDTIVFCPFYYDGIERIPASGGEAVAVSTVDRQAGERSHRWPHGLPGGKTILYSIGHGASWDHATIVAQRLDTGARKVILKGGSDARYVPTGHLVYVRGNSLYAVPFDSEKLELRGAPVEVTTGVANHQAGGAEYAFAANGMLVYFSEGVGGDEGGRLAMVDRRGEPIATTLPPYAMVNPTLSPDGRSIAGMREGDLWTFDTSRGTSTRVTTGVRTIWPTWSPDGSRLYYGSERAGPWAIYTRAADGSDEEQRVTNSSDSLIPVAISPDGGEIMARSVRKETGGDIDLVSLDGSVQPFVRSENHDHPSAFSPDGRWIVYSSDESGRPEVYVRPRSGTGRFQISNAGGSQACWVVQDEIIYSSGSKLMSVRVQTSPSFTASAPELLFERNFATFDVARDGRILLVEAPDTPASSGQLNVVVNWFAEIGRKGR
jgi:eukaryotic-like serine/threonine-protein kinase